ncbi:permease-like cell division protein FtsX [Amycolatopsis anabasis]|uniref:permease-like cell division protein FtsX n=1 Tax=Amycolatopsis anabasis TaxID=1840409 RepID=UPI001FE63427|nr:permease-like cell division protein FtsX [Amycolatopsis anabasis]
MTAPRRLPSPQILAAIVVVVVAAAVAALVIWGANRTVPGTASPIPCPREILTYFHTDADMLAAQDKVRDPRIQSTTSETQLQAYERFKVIFKDQPELVELARPEALPASITVFPTAEADREQLVAWLRAQLPAAQEVDGLRCPWRRPAAN